MKILVVEDEPNLRESIRKYFFGDGNICEVVGNKLSAIEKINLYRYDCIILDINLPDGSGFEVLNALQAGQQPDGILIVSAKDSLDDKLQGLDLGADDYLTKPFHLSELKARVMAIIRRKSFNGSRLINFKEIKVDLLAKQVTVNETPVKLTKKEFALLLYFIANKGKVITKNAIAEHLWGDEIDISDNFDFIYSHIKNLRKKLMDVSGKDYVQSAYGMGYKLTE